MKDPRSWTAPEDDALRKLVAAGMSYGRISAQLNRAKGSIWKRMLILDLRPSPRALRGARDRTPAAATLNDLELGLWWDRLHRALHGAPRSGDAWRWTR